MPALSARHIASSALCAALLVGITGPAALAADSARERSHAASHEARHPSADALLVQIRKIDRGELAPVADLLHAVLKAENGQLPPAEAEKLARAAKAALAKVAAKAQPAPATPMAPPPGTGVLLPAPTGRSADVVSDVEDVVEDALNAVEEAIDALLEAIDETIDAEATEVEVITETTTETETTEDVLLSIEGVLGVVGKLLDGLLGGILPVSSVSLVPSTSTATPVLLTAR